MNSTRSTRRQLPASWNTPKCVLNRWWRTWKVPAVWPHRICWKPLARISTLIDLVLDAMEMDEYWTVCREIGEAER